jgi:hypothetical protein
MVGWWLAVQIGRRGECTIGETANCRRVLSWFSLMSKTLFYSVLIGSFWSYHQNLLWQKLACEISEDMHVCGFLKQSFQLGYGVCFVQ